MAQASVKRVLLEHTKHASGCNINSSKSYVTILKVFEGFLAFGLPRLALHVPSISCVNPLTEQ